MRLLITGLNGSLAPKVAAQARSGGFEVVGWDRRAVSPDDSQAVASWLAEQRLDAIAHLAFGPESFAAQLARHAAEHGIPFLFTSTAMVFHHEPDGPHHVADPRTAKDDYGRYKIRCEDAVRASNPAACIVRLGWQIDPTPSGNNMLAALDAQQAREGGIKVSTRWRPACSFMADTAAAILSLLSARATTTIHLDSNAREGHSFAAIVHALRRTYGRAHWGVRPTLDYAHDQRLLDQAALLPNLSVRLPALLSDEQE